MHIYISRNPFTIPVWLELHVIVVVTQFLKRDQFTSRFIYFKLKKKKDTNTSRFFF